MKQIKEEYQFGFHDDNINVETFGRGLNEDVVNRISEIKSEPSWMRERRLEALNIFLQKPMPTWGGNIGGIDFNNIIYYIKPSEKQEKDWDNVPDEIRKTYDRLGIPEAEKKYLAGVKAQYESEVIYGNLQDELTEQGVIFASTDEALEKYPELLKEYFGKIIPSSDNKLAADRKSVV